MATPVGGAPSVSETTTIEYNRWLVENSAKQEAEARKMTHDEERKMRQMMQEKYRNAGNLKSAELKEQLVQAKKEVAAYRDDNLRRGMEVKEEVDMLRKARKAQNEAFLEHGTQLSREYGSEQKRRIAEEKGALSKRNTLASKALRTQCQEEEKLRAERIQRELEDAQKLKADICAATSDQVTQAAKAMFYEQRKNVGDTTRVNMKEWKEGRLAQKEEYAAKAAAAKAEALAIKKAAKEARAAADAAKAKAAKEMREKRNNIETNSGKVKSDMGTMKKQVHDMTRTRKFVSPQAAETMRQKKAGKLNSPA